MGAYFRIRQDRADHLASDNTFIEKLAVIEEGVVDDIRRICSDREFPDDIRHRIWGVVEDWCIAPITRAAHPGTHKAIAECRMCQTSCMINHLATIFEELAVRRIDTRFGLLTDDPQEIWEAREKHE